MGKSILRVTSADLVLFFSLILVLLPATNVSSLVLVSQVRANIKTIVVPDDCSMIQTAINLANLGDVIYVRAGTYYESIIVNKTISLVGQSRETTIIDGKNEGTVVAIDANGVIVTGFTIREGKTWYPNAGILLSHANNSRIYGNNIYYNLDAIMLSYSSNNSIAGNNIRSNEGYGLELWYSSNNSITENNVESNWGAINLVDSHNNILLENDVTGNLIYDAVWLWSSSNNVLKYNVIDDLVVMGSELADFINDVDVSNKVGGKPVFYIVNQRNLVITQLTHPQIGYLGVVNCTNMTIKNIEVTRTGILLAYTRNSIIQNVTVTDHQRSTPIILSGIRLFSAVGNSLLENTVLNNYLGIWLEKSTNNSILKNTISKNREGLWLQSSPNNNILGNNIEDNDEGILFDQESNRIVHNNFVQNRVNAIGFDDSNLWDDGYPSGGNYWSDYSGIDEKSGSYQDQPGSDGIGDTPYTIDSVNVDHYPLMTPYDISPPTIIILSPENKAYCVNTLALTFRVDEKTLWTGYSLNAQANVTITGNATLPVLPDGRHFVTVFANDTRGNMGISNVHFAVDTTLPKANAGDDQTINEGTMVTLDASRSFDNFGISTYTWAFIDADTLQILEGVNPAYTFQTPGIYTLSLNATDAAGNWEIDTVVITVVDVTEPIANAGQDRTVNVGVTVVFDAGDSTDNVAIFHYEWNFGDGTTGTGVTATHEYASPGTYIVTLTVSDLAGNYATDSITITALAPPGITAWTIGLAVTAITVAIVTLALILKKRK